ncbi:MAG: glutamine-hydrolyzing carbamoyl-phosphate synthase small subunit [Patescibacteria group bacterium]|nr:glutamine-hydrolyzing carbamoyl-phosphate synthase small subunit [Patescibacteria group bacterium]
MIGKLIFEDGSVFEGKSFGFEKSTAGEVVFSTGMVGYPESLTDPSYKGQILIFTYPLIGNYGVQNKKYWESDNIKVSGLIVSTHNNTPSHFLSEISLGMWLKNEKIPALEISDTRFLTQKIRAKGTMLGKIIIGEEISFYNPDKENLVETVSSSKIQKIGDGSKNIMIIDCGVKENIKRCLLKRGLRITIVPWNYDLFNNPEIKKIDGIVVSSGPGDPKKVNETIITIKKALKKKIPILGICLGHQLLALAAEGDTHKLKFGHRSQNQPCVLKESGRCFITTQNHGFAVSKVPPGFKVWFENANDGSNEGIIHENLPFMSVQFHPEASPGPTDTEWIFDEFLKFI